MKWERTLTARSTATPESAVRFRARVIADVRAHHPVSEELSSRVTTTRLRWLVIIPATLVTWVLTSTLAFWFLAIAVRFCPPEQLVSGVCIGSWSHHAEDVVVFGWAVLFGALTVTVAAVIAPSYRAHVATIAFVAGAAQLLYMAFLLSWWGRLSAGLIACAVSWLGVLLWERKLARSNTAVESDTTVPALRASARAPHRER